jgi:hypothetical protein
MIPLRLVKLPSKLLMMQLLILNTLKKKPIKMQQPLCSLSETTWLFGPAKWMMIMIMTTNDDIWFINLIKYNPLL